jgi:hypothetical protein
MSKIIHGLLGQSAFAPRKHSHAFAERKPTLRRLITLAGVLAALLCVAAAPPEGDFSGAEPEDLTRWSHFHEVRLPDKPGKYVDFVLTPSVFGAARPDLADLRLVDAAGKVIPYALRTRAAADEQREVPSRAFDAGTNPDRSAQLTLDLGENPGEYDRIAVDVPGEAYSRRVRVEGSGNGRDWVTVLENRVVDLPLERGKRAEQREFTFAPTRLRYLRVRVWPDRVNEKDEPQLRSARVLHTVRDPGELVTNDAVLGKREPVRQDGQPASAWNVNLGEPNVPVSRLALKVKEDFSRPYQLLGENGEYLASGDGGVAYGETDKDGQPRPLSRTRDGVMLAFNETRARKLRLIVTDSRNPPLPIENVRYSAPARQVIFAPPSDAKMPLRLYSGNPMAAHPNYDFATRLPARPTPTPTRGELGERRANPVYVPPPKPWTERWPYLTDVILVAACAVLAGLLLVLARGAIKRHDALPEAVQTPAPEGAASQQ